MGKSTKFQTLRSIADADLVMHGLQYNSGLEFLNSSKAYALIGLKVGLGFVALCQERAAKFGEACQDDFKWILITANCQSLNSSQASHPCKSNNSSKQFAFKMQHV